MIDYIIVPSVILVVGLALTFFPPKNKMSRYGYRTEAAMKSQETWDLAQILAGRHFIYSGLLSTISFLIVFTYSPSNASRLMAIVIPVLMVFTSIFFIERILKKLE
ncbi:MAG: SdpI family protein [Bacteroidetes bacterium]|nr:SdpI family protein [Bacteroidota bacterium]MDA1119238.1 SdpI family protein [Bacteroidota bacterium]